MPDLTLDEFRDVSKEDLKQILRKESLNAGLTEILGCDEEETLGDFPCQ